MHEVITKLLILDDHASKNAFLVHVLQKMARFQGPGNAEIKRGRNRRFIRASERFVQLCCMVNVCRELKWPPTFVVQNVHSELHLVVFFGHAKRSFKKWVLIVR